MLDAVVQLPVNDFQPRISQEENLTKRGELVTKKRERGSEGPAGEVAIVCRMDEYP